MSRAANIKAPMPQSEKDLWNSQLTDLFKNLDISALTKTLILAGIEWADKNILPSLQASNSTLAFMIATLLDALERAMKA